MSTGETIFNDLYLRDKVLAILHRAAHSILLFSNELLARVDLTFQQAVVLTFIYHNKGCNQRAVEQHIETRSASVTVLLNTMAAKGLIEKVRNPVDGRGIVLSVTGKGRRLAVRCNETFAEITEITCQGISKDDEKTLKRLLGIMVENCTRVSKRAPSQRIIRGLD